MRNAGGAAAAERATWPPRIERGARHAQIGRAGKEKCALSLKLSYGAHPTDGTESSMRRTTRSCRQSSSSTAQRASAPSFARAASAPTAAISAATSAARSDPQPGRHVAIVGEDGPVPQGEEGTIAVHRSDPGLMLGYLGAPEATARKFRGDWFLTGDQGAMDDTGAITYLGRADDMMNAGGFRVSPMEVEAVLNAQREALHDAHDATVKARKARIDDKQKDLMARAARRPRMAC